MTTYSVTNIAGGRGQHRSLEKACEEAGGDFSEPYVGSKRGRRPVVLRWDNDGQYYSIGEYGQSYNDFENQCDEDD